MNNSNIPENNTDGNNHLLRLRREELAPGNITPIEYYGGRKVEWGIDYLKFTIYADKITLFQIYAEIFADYLGDLNYQGETKFYIERYINGAGFSLLCDPRNKNNSYHGRFELPGEICKILPFETYKKFIKCCLSKNIRLKATRIDFKADYCPFTPLDIYNAINADLAETRAHKETLKFYNQPNEIKEDGESGTTGLYLGSRTSERYLRIYDKHGFTRLEIECKEDTANGYFYLLSDDENDFSRLANGLTQDFIRIDTDCWREFTNGYERAYMKTHEYYDPTLDNLKKYFLTQALIPVSILYEILGEKWLKENLQKGIERARENKKYYSIIHAYGLEE